MYRKRNLFQRRPKNARGFTLIELVMSVAIVIILTSAAVPVVNSTLINYRINNATGMLTGAINSSRYRAIYNGYPYTMTISKTAGTYQLASMVPPATSFTNVGSAIPYKSTNDTATADVMLNQDTVTLRFRPSGMVIADTGNMNAITLTYKGKSRTIKVSAYGNVTVTNP